MRVILQKVKEAEVKVEERSVGKIKNGLLIFLGIHKDDEEKDIDPLLKKILELRIFPDETREKYFDISLLENSADILVVSQFTLYGDLKKGRRPSFDMAKNPTDAKKLYDEFVKKLRMSHHGIVETGIFQADMHVSLVNDGPVTFIYDSQTL